MRLIDADTLVDDGLRFQDGYDYDGIMMVRLGDVTKSIRNAPTIDAVHVVRCRECELWNEWDHSGHKELGNFVCSCAHLSNEDGYVVYTKPDDYCSYRERKDGDA